MSRRRNAETNNSKENLSLARSQISIISRQLAVLLGAGVDLRRSLDVLVDGASTENERAILVWLLKCVESGWKLSSAMKQFPRVFDKVYVSMVEVGEETGKLVKILESVANWLEEETKLLRDVKSSLVYPCLVVTVATLLTIFYFVVIFPGLAQSLAASTSVPAPTKVLMVISNFLLNPLAWVIMLLSLATVYKSGRVALGTAEGKIVVWKILNQIPIVREGLRDLAASRFSAAMAILMEGGVDLLKSFRLAVSASGSPLGPLLIEQGTSTITNGGHLSDHMIENPDVYPGIVRGLVITGEQSAQLPEVFVKLKQLLEFDTRYHFEILTSLIEPFIMVMVSILVCTLIVCTSLPLYGLLAEVL